MLVEWVNLSFGLSPLAAGSPLLNEYGEVIGLVTHYSLLPGSRSLTQKMRYGFPGNLQAPGSPYLGQNTLAIPFNLIQSPPAGLQPKTSEELNRLGLLTSPLTGVGDIVRGTLARRVERHGSSVEPVDEKFEFSQSDGQIFVFLMLIPNQKSKTLAYPRIYDLTNRLLASGQPNKIQLDPNKPFNYGWQVNLSQLPPGDYRVDVVFEPNPVWRSFFRIAP